jgi:glutaredoxin 3
MVQILLREQFGSDAGLPAAAPAFAAVPVSQDWRNAATPPIWFGNGSFQEFLARGTQMAAPQIDIYTKFGCPYCVRAKRLLTAKGASFNEYDITLGGPKREEMLVRAPHAMTVPQIFIGAAHVGGSDDLHALDAAGKLDALLAG